MYMCCVYIYITQSVFIHLKHIPQLKKKNSQNKDNNKKILWSFFSPKIGFREENEYSLYV